MNLFTFKSKVWLYPGHAGWHFATVPKQISKEIHEANKHIKRGWGSVPVEVTIGDTVWKTSIFRDAVSSTYLLPLKALVRTKEEIEVDDTVTIGLKLV